jgi:hypothetical protein
MKRLGLTLAACLLGGAAAAQSADTQAILDAIKGLNSRMDDMQQQIDGLKGGGGAAGAATSTPQAASPAEESFSGGRGFIKLSALLKNAQ